MNFEVKSAEDSDFPRMHLVVVDDKSGNHIESPYHYSKDDGSETGAIEVSIAFDNPYTPDEFNEDLQFAMEVQSNSGEEADTPGAEFLGGGAIGCDHNKRVSARLKDSNGIVKLQITDPNAKLKVLAGWATGHEAVRLTHPLILEPALVSDKQETTADNQDDEAEIDEADLKADDDGPTLMDDEIQEENLPKVLNTSDIEADIERDVADTADNDDKPVKMDDEVQEELGADPEKQTDKVNDGIENQGAKEGDEATKPPKKSHAKKNKTPKRAENFDPEDVHSTNDNMKETRRKQKQSNEDGDYSTESVHLNDDKKKSDKGSKPPPKRHSDPRERQKKLLEKERRERIVKGGHDNGKGQDPETKKTFRQLYESEDFANSFHMNGYIYGCVIFFSSFVLMFVFGRRREKGRRDL